MRLDKFLCDALGISRKEAARLLKQGDVRVDDAVEKKAGAVVSVAQQVTWQGKILEPIGVRYIMLNKPAGFVCSHEEEHHPSALSLLTKENRAHLHFAGRLDVDTTGLVLITDDGQWSHRITSPKRECNKTYLVWLADPILDHYVQQLHQGIALRGEPQLIRPAVMEQLGETHLRLTIQEGKYHQVKRMFAALGNKVIQLHREQIGAILLDATLPEGHYRYLTDQEIASF